MLYQSEIKFVDKSHCRCSEYFIMAHTHVHTHTHTHTDNCALLGLYAATSGNFLPTFQHYISVLSLGFKNQILLFLNLEDGTDRLSRNVGNKLPLLAA